MPRTKRTKTNNKKTKASRSSNMTSGRKNTKSRNVTAKSLTSYNRKPGGSTAMLTHAVCALTNPWCDQAIGAKIPDDSTTRSFPFRNLTTMTDGCNAAGAQSRIFLPGYNYFTTYDTSVGTQNPATFAVLSAMSVAPSITPAQYRIVSWGLVLNTYCTPMNASGIVRIRGWNTKEGNSLVSVGCGYRYASFAYDIPVAECKNVHILGHTIDDTYKFFTSPATTNPTTAVGDWVSNGWGPITVHIDGGPASSGQMLDIAVTVHYELTLKDDDFLGTAATPSAPTNNLVAQSVSQVRKSAGNVFKQTVERVENFFISRAENALLKYGARMLPGPMGIAANMAALTVD